MSHQLPAVDHIDATAQDCISACSQCHDICTATVQHCAQSTDERSAGGRIRALLD